MSDQVTQDISKFRAIKKKEDARFFDLVHLVKRSFNTMKGIGKANDMDNNHMLSLTEQKMSIEYRKIWARDLDREKKEACLNGLISWMEAGMKSRMRATAPLRNHTGKYINHISTSKSIKCCLCKSSDHWLDEWEKLKAKSYDERLKLVKENHACFCCLKMTGRVNTELQIVNDESCVHKRLTEDSTNVTIMFLCIQLTLQYLSV